MNSAVKLSSSFYRYVRGSSSNIYKLSNNYTPKCLLNCKYGIQLCDNWRCVSSATDINEPHSTKNSPSWKLKDDKSFNKGTVIAGIATAVCISAVIYHKFHKGVKAETESISIKQNVSDILNNAGTRKDKLPEYTRDQVAKNDGSSSKKVWVTYKNGVYDITDFIPKHPGAKNIMMAAGGSIEPFWSIYAVHNNNSEVYSLLEQYRIGNLAEADVKLNESLSTSSDGDMFANEPKRHPALKVVSMKPFNAEIPLSLAADSFYTPNDLFYVRNHLGTPCFENEDEYELDVSGIGLPEDGKTFKLSDIKKLPKYEVVSTIQCGGNRRAEMKAVKDLKGLPWTGGAIGNAKWGGARLYDVLKAAGMKEDDIRAKHVQFEGYDKGADGSPYGASIPISKAFTPYGDVLLAYEMNGETLPRDHGYPIRAVVPGVVGARNVKWLNNIIVSDVESDSHWQQNDYKSFNPSVDWDTVDFSKSPAIQDMPVTSAICEPTNNSVIKVSKKNGNIINLKGYAWAGSGNRIIRVDLTPDQGKSWFEAKLDEQDLVLEPRHYGWTIWSANMKVPDNVNELEIWSKAVDSSYNVQPESFENIWNLRGLLSNAYFRLKVKLDRTD